ncbi:prepilin-type N-terminal cleavage/methylation domain-containing protein [candidate division KSB1 bacterium]|nr:prepilin-type N-terminal cleavage/methylation domain-containing protein [candidate division KSB1 bacterium]
MLEITNDKKSGQYGLTLIELLIAISISGMLLVAIFQLYFAANQVWSSATKQFQLIQNYIKAIHYIARDVQQADAIDKVTKDYIRLVSGKDKIRYKITHKRKFITIIRYVNHQESKEWIQIPRFPVAEFSTEYIEFESVRFKKISDIQIAFSIDDHDKIFQTVITRRKQF